MEWLNNDEAASDDWTGAVVEERRSWKWTNESMVGEACNAATVIWD